MKQVCWACKEAKPLSDYDKGRKKCKTCRRADVRRRYRELTPDELDDRITKAVRRKRVQRRREGRQRRDEAKFALQLMLDRGISKSEIERQFGVSVRSIRNIVSDSAGYVKQETVNKIYDGLQFVLKHNLVGGKRGKITSGGY